MKFSTSVKHAINACLATLNLRLETLTASKREKARLAKLAHSGHFDSQVFPLLESFSSFDGHFILESYLTFRDDCQRLLAQDERRRRYNPINDYFPPADACPTYLMARRVRPNTWLEIGSGHSTGVVRQAI